MLNFTPLARPIFAGRAADLRRHTSSADVERQQRRVLAHLLHRAAGTEVGRRYGFTDIDSAEAFVKTLPLNKYQDIRADVLRMVSGQADVLWPGVCRRFAQSSGTSDGKSKYIPVTNDALSRNHYAGSFASVATYLGLYPDSHIFAGKSFILGGSYATELEGIPEGVSVGDLSATLINNINPLVNLFRVPSKDIALMPDWSRKLPAIARAAIGENITNISGVPSWFLTVIQRIMALGKVDNIHKLWPNLEVFFHGGIAFGPYREQYAAITDTNKIRYHENYNASEGFFAVQDTAEGGSMRLLTDIDVFYEFIPLEHHRNDEAPTLMAWQLTAGETYAMVISASNGLWRYIIGDTVKVESTEPLRISIAGRTSSFINAFGEELMVWNADAALAAACHKTGAAVANYTAAPVFAHDGAKGHHQWLIEWNKAPECGNEAFADILDAELQSVNSDYQAKRSGDIFLARLALTELPRGTFDRWLASTGKLGGQRKIPRLCNDRRIADGVLAFAAK